MREGASGQLREIRVCFLCPILTQCFKEKIHSTSTRFASRLANCGANKRNPRMSSTSTCGIPIWNQSEGSTTLFPQMQDCKRGNNTVPADPAVEMPGQYCFCGNNAPGDSD